LQTSGRDDYLANAAALLQEPKGFDGPLQGQVTDTNAELPFFQHSEQTPHRGDNLIDMVREKAWQTHANQSAMYSTDLKVGQTHFDGS